jgi:hypothetical protein
VKKNLSDVEVDNMLEEYKALRAEIVSQQQQRTAVLGFTLAGVGVTASLAAKMLDPTAPNGGELESVYPGLVVLLVLYILIIIATAMTAAFTQAIDHLANYIRKFIEPNTPGLRWESRWAEVRGAKDDRGYKRLGLSKTYSLVYGVMTVCAVSLTAALMGAVPGHQRPYAQAGFGLVAVIAVYFVIDLWLRRRRSWLNAWANVPAPERNG